MVSEKQHLDGAIDKGVSYLMEHQYPNGEFCCYMAPDDEMLEWCVPDTSIFPTTLIATTLLELRRTKEIEIMLERSTNFLRYHMVRGGTWSHWTKWHKVYHMSPVDADNTVCASYLLKQLGIVHPDGMRMLHCNRDNQGLFYTWLVFHPSFRQKLNITFLALAAREIKNPLGSLIYWIKYPSKRSDIDAVVNANILFRFGLTSATRPIVDYMIDIILTKNEGSCDKWYQNPIVVYYFFSRAYTVAQIELEPLKEPIVERIMELLTAPLPALEAALAITSLLNFESDPAELEPLCTSLMQQQGENGSWKRRLLYYGGPQRRAGWGSEELTTGFCLEALRKYQLHRFTDI
jgi:hypothetical protein